MSILKGILHHWNKTNSAYDTIHPETEVAQVTDWNNGIVNTMASTALGTLVNTLTSDSLLATMIQKVLTATGVKYSMGQNGYVCLGSFFGGLIIQWVNGVAHGNQWNKYALPITVSTALCAVTSATEVANKTNYITTNSVSVYPAIGVGIDEGVFIVYVGAL